MPDNYLTENSFNNDQRSKSKLPVSKMELIEKVGSKGTYQFILLIIFCGVWGVTGLVLMGNTFFFLDSKFKCEKKGLLVEDCQESVCYLEEEQWKNYVIKQDGQLNTIAVQFGNYHCDNQIYLNITQSCIYIGAFVGYLLFSFFADNYGRRSTFIISWSIAVLGAILFYFSQNLIMVGFALFLLGAGSDAAVNMCFNFLAEVVEDETRQKYSVFLQPWFPIGACFVTTMFMWVDEWRPVVLFLIVIPTIIILIMIIVFVEETPQFLVRKGIPQTLKALNRIGYINKNQKKILTQQDIQNVIEAQVQEKQFQKMITPLDLFRYPSLRTTTISLSFIAFAVYALYYGPVLIIDKIGFNVYVSSYVVQFSELIVYIPLYFSVRRLPRQKTAIVLFIIAGLCSALLLFIRKPKNCDLCAQGVAQLLIVAVFRSSSALEFILMYIYMVQLFPARARAMGGGIASSVGTVASSSSPLILGIFSRNNLNQNTLFFLLSLLAVAVSTFLPETLGKKLKQEIEQIQEVKEELKIKRSKNGEEKLKSI